MKRPNTNINVTFYLKKTSKNSDRRGIYANITFRSTQRQIATKVYANHPDHFQRGGLIGYEYHEQNISLIEMKRKLEGYDGHLFNDIDQVLDYYYGGDIVQYKSTILEVFDYSLEHSKHLSGITIYNKKKITDTFLYFIKSKPTIYSNFSVIKNAPRQMFRTHAIDYTNYLKDCGLKHSSIYQYTQVLKSLFNLFSKNHIDQIPDLIHNPFKDIIKQKGKNERKKKALARAIDWRYVDQIKKLEYSDTKDKMHQLMALIQANTGLSFVEFGKEDCLEVSQTINGPALIGTRQKGEGDKKYGDYCIFLNKEVNKLTNKLKPILFEPYIRNNKYIDREKQSKMKSYNKFLLRLAKEIEFEDDEPLTSHRLRHTFGMHCMNDLKMQVHIVAKMMGDSVETILNNYADLSTDNVILEQKEQLEKMSIAV
jgi:integrase